MINQLYIDGFKCHSALTLKLSNLTVLVGTNSSGKSSVIQALLLASHNVTNNHGSPLNGHLLSVGDFKDARNHVTNSKKIEIATKSGDDELRLIISEHRNHSDGKLSFIQKPSSVSDLLNYSNNNLHYLSAHRLGNQTLHAKNYDKIDTFGIYGEYAIDYFESNKSKIIDDLLISDDRSYTLQSQVNYWLQLIVGHSLLTSDIIGTDRIKAEYSNLTKKNVSAKNTGSGVSYLVSILITCLSCKANDIVIIENPELHLHPKAQSLLTDFFIFIANAGIQLIIETHSDHIFNGIRVNIYNKKIALKNISANFFTINPVPAISSHTNIKFNRRGSIENQKKLLFDQFDSDINTLVGL